MVTIPSRLSRIVRAAVVALPFAFFSAGASAASEVILAQDTTQQPPPAMNPPAAQIPDSQVQAFAKSVVQIQKIDQDAQQALQSAGSAQEKEAASAKMEQLDQERAKAVQDNGLTVEDFNAIAAAARSDPQLLAKVEQYMKEYSN